MTNNGYNKEKGFLDLKIQLETIKNKTHLIKGIKSLIPFFFG